MQLWMTWWGLVWQLRPAFSRKRTFLWAAVALAGFSTRRDLFGIASFIQLGLIAQGLLQYLAVSCPVLVWNNFNGWMRTQKTDKLPSEAVVGSVLQNTLPEFLADSTKRSIFKKFLRERIDFDRHWTLGRVA